VAGIPYFTDAGIGMLADLARREKASADEGLCVAQARADDAAGVLGRLIQEQRVRGLRTD
jgi:hypothetical protein